MHPVQMTACVDFCEARLVVSLVKVQKEVRQGTGKVSTRPADDLSFEHLSNCDSLGIHATPPSARALRLAFRGFFRIASSRRSRRREVRCTRCSRCNKMTRACTTLRFVRALEIVLSLFLSQTTCRERTLLQRI